MKTDELKYRGWTHSVDYRRSDGGAWPIGARLFGGVYKEVLALEFAARDIPFRRELPIAICYKDQILACDFRADFVSFCDILVELKALAGIGGNEQAQVFNYLKATGLRLGLLLNFIAHLACSLSTFL